MALAYENRGRKKGRKSRKSRKSSSGRTTYRALVKKLGVKAAARKWRSLSASSKIRKAASSKSRKVSSGGKKLSSWQRFVKNHRGSGKSLRALASMYRKGSGGKKSRKSSKSGKSRKGLSKWQRFVKSHKGKGYSLRRLASLYRKGKAARR